MKRRLRQSCLYLAVVALVAIGLSSLFDVPYVMTVLGIAAWVALGHLITLDDDLPGEWSNMEHSGEVWKRSMIEFAIKLLMLVAIAGVVLMYPELREFGA